MSAYDLAAILSDQLGLDADAARDVALAAGDLWYELSLIGWADAPYGPECLRVIPQALAFIHREANRGPTAGLELVTPDPKAHCAQTGGTNGSTTIPRPSGPIR